MKKRLFIILLVVVLLSTLVFIGCSNKKVDDVASNDGKKGKEGKVTIRFATWDTGDKLKIQQDIAKKFEKENPNVKVQVEAYGDGFDQKIAASFGAKNPPDVLYMWDFPTYYESLMPLDELIEKDKELELEDIYQGLFNYCTVDEATYGLPAGFTTHVIYYNKDLFDEVNIPYPEDGWTWDEFVEIAKKLTDPSKKQYGFGFSTNPDPYDFEQFFWSNGTSYISEDGKEIEGYINSNEAIEVMDKFITMIDDNSAYVYGSEASQGAGDIFKSGKLGMYESGIWPLESFKEAGINLGVVELPSFGEKPSKSVINVTAVSIAKDSKYQNEAWEFAKYFLSEESIEIRKTDLPIRESFVTKKDIKSDKTMKPFYTMLERAEDNTPAYLLNPNWKEIQQNLSFAIESMYSEGKNSQRYLDEAVELSKKFLK